MTSYDFTNSPFQHVPTLMREVDALYNRIVEKHGESMSLLSLTAQQIVRARNWKDSAHMFSPSLDAVLDELKVFFVPKALQPGPAIVFPQQDIYGTYTRARMKPLYDLEVQGTNVKYAALGVKKQWKGPAWFGNSFENTIRLVTRRKVVIVEGPFDLLACRLLCPDLPILSSGTKAINDMHLDYLQIMGVREIALMFDNEPEKGVSGGTHAMQQTAAMLKADGRFRAKTLTCPAQDPSACLEREHTARALRRLLHEAFDD